MSVRRGSTIGAPTGTSAPPARSPVIRTTGATVLRRGCSGSSQATPVVPANHSRPSVPSTTLGWGQNEVALPG